MENENTASMARTQAQSALILNGIAGNLDSRDGLRNVLYSIAQTANEEHWSLEDLLVNMRRNWSESSERHHQEIDGLREQLTCNQIIERDPAPVVKIGDRVIVPGGKAGRVKAIDGDVHFIAMDSGTYVLHGRDELIWAGSRQ